MKERVGDGKLIIISMSVSGISMNSIVVNGAYIQNGHKPKRPQTKTATKRPQSDTKTTFTQQMKSLLVITCSPMTIIMWPFWFVAVLDF